MSRSVTSSPSLWGEAGQPLLRKLSAAEGAAVPNLQWGTATDVGVVRRGHANEDRVYAAAFDGGGLFAVADGMGGHAAGEVAARLALETFVRKVEGSQKPLYQRMILAAEAANQAIFEKAIGKRAGMGTTLTAAVIKYDHVMLTHIGDSRAYVLRDNILYRLTEDHSWVAEQVRLGQLSPAEAERHRWRNVVSNALGGESQLRLEVYSAPILAGDRLLLCTDGLYGPVNGEQILGLLSLPYPPSRVAKLLIDQANQRGGPDNVSAVVIDVNAVTPSPKALHWPARLAGGPQSAYRLITQLRRGSPIQSLLLTVLYLVLIGMALLPLYRPVIAAAGIALLLALLLLYRRSLPAAPETVLQPEATLAFLDRRAERKS